MQAPGHLITNISLAVVTENLLHLAGPPLHWPGLMQLAPVGVTAALLPKALFYGVMFLTATLPDSDQRVPFLGKHRGFTHSIIGLLVLTAVLLSLFFGLAATSTKLHVTLPDQNPPLAILVLITFPLGCAFHILADLITIRGVRLFWPAQKFIRLVPKSIAIKNQHSSEYSVVALLFLTTSLLVFLNLFGL